MQEEQFKHSVENREESEETFFTLQTLIALVLDKWHWFALSVVLCCTVAAFYIASAQPVFELHSLVLIKTYEKQGMNTEMSKFLELGGMGSNNRIQNELYLLQSSPLIGEVVRRLHLDVVYQSKLALRYRELFDNNPIKISFLDAFRKPVRFTVTPISEDSCLLSNFQWSSHKIDKRQVVAYYLPVSTPIGTLTIQPKLEGDSSLLVEEPVTVSRNSIAAATVQCKNNIRAILVEKYSTVIDIASTGTNFAKSRAILNTLMEVYTEYNIEDKNQIARSTAKFLNERIDILIGELSQVDSKLANFKSRNKVINFETMGQQFLTESGKAKDEVLQLEMQVTIAKYIKDYLNDATKKDELIPGIVGFKDLTAAEQITIYNETVLQRNRLIENSGSNSPVVSKLDGTITALRSSIKSSLDATIKSLQIQLSKAQTVESRATANIESVPAEEKTSLDAIRQQAIKEPLYTFLLQKREENAITLAITDSNAKMIEPPFGKKTAPRRAVIMLAAFLIGLAIPFGFVYVIALLDTKVRSRKDIEDLTTLPVLGDIPTRKETDMEEEILVKEGRNDYISEAFRLIRSNLTFMNKDARVIMFTSTMAGEGKTFVSRNLAVTIAMGGKKVILVDSDIRKAKQSRLFDVKGKAGLSNYLAGSESDLKKLIVSSGEHDSFDLLPAGTIPPNPAELLMSDQLEVLITELKKRYDTIIVDNVPAMVVADAGIVNRVADLTIYVIRVGLLDRRYLPELEKIHQTGKFKNMCVILNDSQMEKNGYGYGYGYHSDNERDAKAKKLKKHL